LDINTEYAVLMAANSDGGQRMLLRNHRIKVGGFGIVGFVAQTGLPRIAENVNEDAMYFNNIDLPDTQSELALPLSIGNVIIGALDVQSTQAAAFTKQDIETLSLLADQVSIAIQNAKLFEETRSALQEAQKYYTQSAAASWREINRQSAISGFRYANGKIEAFNTDSSTMDKSTHGVTSNKGSELTGKSDVQTEHETISIPINIRGQSLGTLNIRQPGRTHAWRDSEVHLFQSIVDRLSFALENARLYVDAQKRAAKERVIGDIGAKISSSVSLDNILQVVVEELGRTLPGSEVVVQFEKDSLGVNVEPGGAQ
jgi:GAF domain-containing protein